MGMGRRGEGYVVIQFLLFFAIAFAPSWGPLHALPVLRPIGAILFAIGAILGLWGLYALGRNLTPLPHPRDGNHLVQHGPYRIVRHPIYAAVLIGAFGYSLFRFSFLGLLLTILLLGLFDFKTKREEQWLVERHPEYIDYQKRVRKLIPWVY